ncbi:septal ring factor EnvC (AmiA/AmiB activator) [Stella humosa]|uniref:Septal ring factor EnvC (AmiA/AmiB activator) n=1 Tax=Stella humosa TaxID=94 RepID=A0A3N1KVT5_9PROT|nr:peptidoglycan DD-metalloendopeptidase family protein [Stella humosa]ROP83367.1 septal ring factor EnvC (AmiA/AmiB activator) [Stella humosa]BBK29849.1 peptidase M23 [Stella humosa]
MRHGAAVLLVLGGTLLALPAGAQDARRELRDVQKSMEAERSRQAEIERRAETLRREVERLRNDSIAVARALQTEEANLSSVEETLTALNEEIERQTRSLAERRQSVEALMTALTRLTRHPPEALLALPTTPLETARTAGLLGNVVPMIAREAAGLRLALADLRELRLETENRRQQAANARAMVERRRKALDGLIAQRTAARGDIEAEARQRAQALQQMATKAGDLRELIVQAEAERRRQELEKERQRQEAEFERRRLAAEAERRRQELAAEEARQREASRPDAGRRTAEIQRLDQERQAMERDHAAQQRREEERQVANVLAARVPSVRGFNRARGQYILPAVGSVQRSFGDDLGFGQHSRGITLRTRPGARVVAPFDGRILFIGPFRAYGEILIIEHSDGYHSLVAGLGRTDGTVGQTVLSGEPVGVMTADGEERPRLYIELRRNGTPINPQPWLAAGEGKESG